MSNYYLMNFLDLPLDGCVLTILQQVFGGESDKTTAVLVKR